MMALQTGQGLVQALQPDPGPHDWGLGFSLILTGFWLVSSDLSFTRQGLQVQTLARRNVKEFADKRKARFENPRIGPFCLGAGACL